MGGIGRKIASIAAGIFLLVALSWAKGWFRGPDSRSGPDVEIRLKVAGAEKTLTGRLEGPVTHVW